jgi:hypothetical protein
MARGLSAACEAPLPLAPPKVSPRGEKPGLGVHHYQNEHKTFTAKLANMLRIKEKARTSWSGPFDVQIYRSEYRVISLSQSSLRDGEGDCGRMRFASARARYRDGFGPGAGTRTYREPKS